LKELAVPIIVLAGGCFSPVAGILLFERCKSNLRLMRNERFSPVAGILLFERSLGYAVDAGKRCFSPVAGILLFERPPHI